MFCAFESPAADRIKDKLLVGHGCSIK